MRIHPIVYDAFTSLTSGNQVVSSPDRGGCAWYVTTDRRVAGRVYLEPESEDFRYSVLHFASSAWEIRAPSRLYGNFNDAETALFEAMQREAGGKPVTIREVPLKTRFGKGQSRNAIPTAMREIGAIPSSRPRHGLG